MNYLRNSVQLIGNLGKDTELRETSKGTKYTKITVATNDYYKNNKGELQKTTQWHNIIAWGKTAERMCSTLQKGSEVLIQGRLEHSTYEDKDGNTRYTSEVKVSEFLKLSKTPKQEEAPVPF